MTDLDIVRDLKADRCQCGKKKHTGHSFCRPCYGALGIVRMKKLYTPLRSGYFDVFRECVGVLQQMGYVPR